MTLQTKEKEETSIPTKGPKRISLEELGKLEVPYGRNRIFKAYKDANFLDRRDATTNERVFRDHFYPKAIGSQKDRPRPITKEVQGIYRLKHKGKEYLMYHALFRATDWEKNEMDFSLLMGKYEIPEFHFKRDANTDQVIDAQTQIMGHQTSYDIPFTKEKAQELIEMGIERIGLTVIDSTGKKWSCSKQEFINVDFDELVDRKSGFAAYLEERRSSSSEKRR
jgi:hypothetical protein